MPLRDVAVMELFYSSGLRLSELTALDVSDLDVYNEICPRVRQGTKGTRLPGCVRRFGSGFAVIAPPPMCIGPLFINKQRRRISTRSIWLVLKISATHLDSDLAQPAINCVTASPPIYSIKAPICAAFRPCSGTRVYRQRKSTRMFRSNA